MRRALVTFLTLALLWGFVSELNHQLAPWHVYLWIGGLFVTFSAINLPFSSGLLATLMGGFLIDAYSPVAFGTHALLFAAAHAIIFNMRDRIPRDETIARVIIALLTNLALFLVFSFIQVTRLPSPAAVWPRIILDLISSQVFLALIAPWFLALQFRALEVAGPLVTYSRRNAE